MNKICVREIILIFAVVPALATVVSALVWIAFDFDLIKMFITNSYVILASLTGGFFAFSVGVYFVFFQKTVSKLGRVIKAAGYDKIFNLGFVVPILIHFVTGILVIASGQFPSVGILANTAFYFLLLSVISVLTNIKNLSGFRSICLELEAEIERYEK